MAAEAVDELGRSSFSDDLAVIDYGQAVAETFCFVHVVSGEQDGATLFLEDTDDIPELAAALGIESGGRLVEKEDARIADQGGRDGETLLLAAGKFADPGVSLFGEFELFENFVGEPRFTVEAGKEFDGLADVQFFRQARFLQRDTDPFAKLARVVVPGVSEDADFSGSGCEQALEYFDGGGLPCSVWAKESEALAGFDTEADATDGFDFSVVGLAQVGALDGDPTSRL